MLQIRKLGKRQKMFLVTDIFFRSLGIAIGSFFFVNDSITFSSKKKLKNEGAFDSFYVTVTLFVFYSNQNFLKIRFCEINEN